MESLVLCDPPSVFASASYAQRVRDRLVVSVQALGRAPDKSFPQAFTPSQYTGFVRVVHNPRVIERPPLDEVVADTIRRIGRAARVIAVHDTTEMCFGGEVLRDGLGRLNKHNQGFLAHTCLAVFPDRPRTPIGVLHIEPLVRAKGAFTDVSFLERYADPERESQRWHRGVRAAEQALGRPGVMVHVMDREADDYTLLLQMHEESNAFVVRQRVDRVLGPGHPQIGQVRTVQRLMQAFAVPVLGRRVEISRRGKARPPDKRKTHPDRDARVARLEIEAMTVTVQRPAPASCQLAPSLELNLVHVREVDVPEGQEPVDWWLFTNLPIDTPEAIVEVVDTYLARWVIEEFFKAIKTGCQYEARQLESLDALWIALLLLLPIATRLVQLRQVAREEPTRDALDVVSEEAIEVLRASGRTRLPPSPTAHDVLYAIAALGGHLKHNGPPGWLILWRGMRDLHERLEGWRAAKAALGKSASRIRDQ